MVAYLPPQDRAGGRHIHLQPLSEGYRMRLAGYPGWVVAPFSGGGPACLAVVAVGWTLLLERWRSSRGRALHTCQQRTAQNNDSAGIRITAARPT